MVTLLVTQEFRPANKYDFGVLVRFFAEISPTVRQYDLRPQKYDFQEIIIP
jgi:hypothetical protein